MLRKQFALISLVVIAVTALIFFIFVATLKDEIDYVCIKEKCFKIEIADNLEERIKGLSGREYLDDNSGMLFIFDEEGEYSFWMKDMKFSIDIIWINSNKEIVYIEKNAQPCLETCPSLNPGIKGLYVLEINSNLSEEFEIGAGDKVLFK